MDLEKILNPTKDTKEKDSSTGKKRERSWSPERHATIHEPSSSDQEHIAKMAKRALEQDSQPQAQSSKDVSNPNNIQALLPKIEKKMKTLPNEELAKIIKSPSEYFSKFSNTDSTSGPLPDSTYEPVRKIAQTEYYERIMRIGTSRDPSTHPPLAEDPQDFFPNNFLS